MWTVGACDMCGESCVWSCGDESAKDHVILLPRIFYENFERSAAAATPFQREHPPFAFFGCAPENRTKFKGKATPSALALLLPCSLKAAVPGVVFS